LFESLQAFIDGLIPTVNRMCRDIVNTSFERWSAWCGLNRCPIGVSQQLALNYLTPNEFEALHSIQLTQAELP
jgi:hypothetical protein